MHDSSAHSAGLRGPLAEALHDLLPGWAAREQEAEAAAAMAPPPDTVAEIRASRVLAAPLPRALGGSDDDLYACASFVRRVARVAPATALCLSMPLGNAANARIHDDAVEPGERAGLAEGRAFIAAQALAGRILAVANSEPGAQGSLERTVTRAERAADGSYTLTGRKSFATWGATADYFLCAARLEDGALDAFFVARNAEGVRVDPRWEALGMGSSGSVGITLERAPASQRFLQRGAIAGTSARHWSTVLLASVFLGVGEGALGQAVACTAPDSATTRATLADRALALEAAWGLIEAVARADRVPAPSAYRERCQRAKTFAARASLDTCTSALVLAGGKAFRPGHDLARFLHAALAGPLVRPPLAAAMDTLCRAPALCG